MSSSSMAALGRSGIRWWLRISIGINISLIIFIVHRLQNGPLSGSAEDTIFRYSADRHQPQHEAQVHVPAPEKHVTTPSPALPPPTLQVNPPPVALPRGCGMCDVNPDLCDQLGADNVARSLAYIGSNGRLRRVLAKIRRGEPFNVGVIGGSVSKGHGIRSLDAPYDPINMHRIVFDWMDKQFPGEQPAVLRDSGKPVGANGFMNGAQGGIGSDYFSMCFSEHISEDIDLVLVELAINDERLMKNQGSFELLLRGLLDLPGDPAIINLQSIALVFPDLSMGTDLHTGIAEFYDVPTISLRNMWLHQILQNYTKMEDIFHPDPDNADPDNSVDGYDQRHLNNYGHKVMADLVTTYMQTQLCEMDRMEASAKSEDIDDLYPRQPTPRVRVIEKFNKNKVIPPIRPNCFSANAVKNVLVPAENKGWRKWNWKEKKYLIADKPGSKVSFKFSTGLGSVELYYQRSKRYGLGNAKCWVDDDVDKAVKLEGYWDLQYNIGQSKQIRTDLSPGDHVLHCELLRDTKDPSGGHEFRIISVMSV